MFSGCLLKALAQDFQRVAGGLSVLMRSGFRLAGFGLDGGRLDAAELDGLHAFAAAEVVLGEAQVRGLALLRCRQGLLAATAGVDGVQGTGQLAKWLCQAVELGGEGVQAVAGTAAGGLDGLLGVVGTVEAAAVMWTRGRGWIGEAVTTAGNVVPLGGLWTPHPAACCLPLMQPLAFLPVQLLAESSGLTSCRAGSPSSKSSGPEGSADPGHTHRWAGGRPL